LATQIVSILKTEKV